MRKFKLIDVWINIILILSSIFIAPFITHDLEIIYCYFIVGGWQIISMTIHYLNKWFIKESNKRKYYQLLVLAIIILFLVGLYFNPILALLAYPLLFLSPFMAIYYTSICFNEVYYKMRRPLSQLK